jgi:hypothetical protein
MTASSLSNLVGRFAAALAVAFFASGASFFLVLPLFPGAGSIAVGFFGVFLGSLCLARRSRVIGSLLLALIGSALYLQFWTRVQFNLNRFEWSEIAFPLMPGIAVGGILASAVLAWWTRGPRHSQQIAPANGGPA